ncbi:MAG: hypothetical protein U1D30_01050 [Planctomycetota bacterium]
MDYDEHGFPKPVDFEDSKPRKRAEVSFQRLGLVVLVLFIAALIGGTVNYGPDFLKNLPANLIPMGSRDEIIRKINVFLSRGDIDRALAQCDKLIAIDPKEGHTAKAEIYIKLERYKESIEEFTHILAIDPNDASSYNNRAYHRALARIDLDGAEKDVQKALEIGGNEPSYIDTRGYLHYLNGRYQPALEDFNQIIENANELNGMRRREFGEILFHRGLVYRKLGKQRLAENDFAFARRLGFDFETYPEPLAEEAGDPKDKAVGKSSEPDGDSSIKPASEEPAKQADDPASKDGKGLEVGPAKSNPPSAKEPPPVKDQGGESPEPKVIL